MDMKPPEFLHAQSERLEAIAEAARGLETPAPPAPVVVETKELAAPVLTPIEEAGRQELGSSTAIHAPLIDMSADIAKGIENPLPAPEAPPAWQLPQVEMPSGFSILQPHKPACHKGADYTSDNITDKQSSRPVS